MLRKLKNISALECCSSNRMFHSEDSIHRLTLLNYFEIYFHIFFFIKMIYYKSTLVNVRFVVSFVFCLLYIFPLVLLTVLYFFLREMSFPFFNWFCLCYPTPPENLATVLANYITSYIMFDPGVATWLKEDQT